MCCTAAVFLPEMWWRKRWRWWFVQSSIAAVWLRGFYLVHRMIFNFKTFCSCRWSQAVYNTQSSSTRFSRLLNLSCCLSKKDGLVTSVQIVLKKVYFMYCAVIVLYVSYYGATVDAVLVFLPTVVTCSSSTKKQGERCGLQRPPSWLLLKGVPPGVGTIRPGNHQVSWRARPLQSQRRVLMHEGHKPSVSREGGGEESLPCLAAACCLFTGRCHLAACVCVLLRAMELDGGDRASFIPNDYWVCLTRRQPAESTWLARSPALLPHAEGEPKRAVYVQRARPELNSHESKKKKKKVTWSPL